MIETFDFMPDPSAIGPIASGLVLRGFQTNAFSPCWSRGAQVAKNLRLVRASGPYPRYFRGPMLNLQLLGSGFRIWDRTCSRFPLRFYSWGRIVETVREAGSSCF